MITTFSAIVSVHLMVVSGAAQEPCRGAGKEPYPCVAEGPRVGGKPHGAWVLRYADGDVAEGPYVYGKRDGDWLIRGADGTVIEAPFGGRQASRRLGLALRGRNKSDCPVHTGQADEAGTSTCAAGGDQPMIFPTWARVDWTRHRWRRARSGCLRTPTMPQTTAPPPKRRSGLNA